MGPGDMEYGWQRCDPKSCWPRLRRNADDGHPELEHVSAADSGNGATAARMAPNTPPGATALVVVLRLLCSTL
jgi:hypothetical protein